MRIKIETIIDYALGLSYRKIRQKLKFLYGIKAAVSTIFEWVKAFQKRARIKVEAKRRKAVAVDETVVKVCGHKCWIWAAIDVGTKELIAHNTSAGRSSLDSFIFLCRVKAKCKGDLPVIYRDKDLGIKMRLKDLDLNMSTEHLN